MTNCPFHKWLEKIWLKRKSDLENTEITDKDSTKEKVKDILEYLTESDLETVKESNQNISIVDLIDFIQSITHLELKEFTERISLYVKENLSDLQKLKKELNNLHVKMFWEYFKNELEELWEHDFIWLEDWKIVNVPLVNYTWSLSYINNNSKDEELKIDISSIISDYFDRFLFIETTFLKKWFSKEVNSYVKLTQSLSRLNILSWEFWYFFEELYKKFLDENKDNKLISLYLLLESNITDEILFNSSFNFIFPNQNRLNLIKYIEYNFLNNIETNISDIKDFLKRQNKSNLNRALNWWSFWTQLYNLYWKEYAKYNKSKWVVDINMDDISEKIIDEINNLVKKHKLEDKWDWKCPFAKTKSWTQDKNIFIEEFDFFDKYMIKVLEQFYD